MSISETSNCSSARLKSEVKQSVHRNHVAHWNSTLDPLQVQSKFKDIVVLEGTSHVWNRMLAGLPAGQLSFLLRAGADCLPTCHWNYRVSNSYPLCQCPNAFTAHILNECPEALNQGRFSWRHDSVLNCLVSQVLPKIDGSTKMFADLPGKRASDSTPATIPADISTTTSRPDLVLIAGPEVTFLEQSPSIHLRLSLQPGQESPSSQTTSSLQPTLKIVDGQYPTSH